MKLKLTSLSFLLAALCQADAFPDFSQLVPKEIQDLQRQAQSIQKPLQQMEAAVQNMSQSLETINQNLNTAGAQLSESQKPIINGQSPVVITKAQLIPSSVTIQGISISETLQKDVEFMTEPIFESSSGLLGEHEDRDRPFGGKKHLGKKRHHREQEDSESEMSSENHEDEEWKPKKHHQHHGLSREEFTPEFIDLDEESAESQGSDKIQCRERREKRRQRKHWKKHNRKNGHKEDKKNIRYEEDNGEPEFVPPEICNTGCTNDRQEDPTFESQVEVMTDPIGNFDINGVIPAQLDPTFSQIMGPGPAIPNNMVLEKWLKDIEAEPIKAQEAIKKQSVKLAEMEVEHIPFAKEFNFPEELKLTISTNTPIQP